MKYEFKNDDLKKLFEDARFTGGLPRDVVKAFRRRMQYIDAAADERDFYAMKSLRYEKLKGKRREERSMRLNDQYRLIVRTEGDGGNRTLLILSIEDYH